MTNTQEILDSDTIQYSNLAIGLKDNIFYFGKCKQYQNCLIEMIITSDKQILSNLSRLNNKAEKNENEINNWGLHYKDVLMPANYFWGEDSIKEYLSSTEKLSNPKKLFIKIRNKITEFMDLHDERVASVVAIYIMNTYLYELYNSVGYLLINSEKDSGKTKFLELVNLMSFNSVIVSSPSESSLFRLIAGNRGLLILDDLEIKQRKDDKSKYILEILRVGYKKSGCVPRTECINNQFIPTLFSVYGPKCISNTTSLDSITLSRCITINLMPTDSTKGKLMPNENDIVWKEIRNEAHIFALENFKEIQQLYQEYDNSLFNNRQMERIKAILALSKFICEDIYKEVEDYLCESINNQELQDLSNNWDFLLFQTLYEMTTENLKWYSVKEIDSNLKWVITLDNNTGLNTYIGNVLSRIPIIKKTRAHEGIKYLLSKPLIEKYMNLRKWPIPGKTTEPTPPSLSFEEDEIIELSDFKESKCHKCNCLSYNKWKSKYYEDRFYCVTCVENEAKRKSDKFTDELFGISKTNLGD